MEFGDIVTYTLFSALPCLIGDTDGTLICRCRGLNRRYSTPGRGGPDPVPACPASTGEANAPRGLVWHGTVSRQVPGPGPDADADRMAPGICHRPVGLGPAALYHSKQTMPIHSPKSNEKGHFTGLKLAGRSTVKRGFQGDSRIQGILFSFLSQASGSADNNHGRFTTQGTHRLYANSKTQHQIHKPTSITRSPPPPPTTSPTLTDTYTPFNTTRASTHICSGLRCCTAPTAPNGSQMANALSPRQTSWPG